MEHNFCNDAIRWQMLNSINVIFTCLIFAQVRPVHMKLTKTHSHTNTETDRAIGIV